MDADDDSKDGCILEPMNERSKVAWTPRFNAGGDSTHDRDIEMRRGDAKHI